MENIGHDGSGVHCGENCTFNGSVSMNKQMSFDTKVAEDSLTVQRIQDFYKSQKKSFFVRVVNKLSRIISGKNLIK